MVASENSERYNALMEGFSWYDKRSTNELQTVNKHISICSLADVQLRFLCPSDLNEVRALCQDWFPIDYPLKWYEDITSCSRFYALAAVYKQVIIGLIVAEIKPFVKLNHEDEDILPPSFTKKAEVGYILSLGVTKQYRHNGVASLLLDSLIGHLTTAERNRVKAVFLHVLTTNKTAIKFYEHRHFHLHKFLPYYYFIEGKCRDGFTYVLYINDGHPPWGLYDYVKYWCSVALKFGKFFSWFSNKMIGPVQWFRPVYHRQIQNSKTYSSNLDQTIDDLQGCLYPKNSIIVNCSQQVTQSTCAIMGASTYPN